VLGIGATGSLRGEPWMRDRVAERLSVALACGELSPARTEMERCRYPALRDALVRSKLWLVPRLGQAVPPTPVLEEMFVWLEAARSERRKLGADYPPARMAEGTVPSAESWAAGVVEEARKRLDDKETRDSGLMQLDGVTKRWKGTSAAEQASKLLDKHGDWRKVHTRRQAEFAYREAKALDAWLGAARTVADALNRPAIVRAAIARWEEVEKHGDDGESQEARKRLAELRKLLPYR
jgi:hypothetical protein